MSCSRWSPSTKRTRLEFSRAGARPVRLPQRVSDRYEGRGHHGPSVFDSYAPYKGDLSRRNTGSLVSFETGESITHGLFNAQERGQLFIGAGVPVYAGMVVGVSPEQEDITVNVCKKKQLTNTAPPALTTRCASCRRAS